MMSVIRPGVLVGRSERLVVGHALKVVIPWYSPFGFQALLSRDPFMPDLEPCPQTVNFEFICF